MAERRRTPSQVRTDRAASELHKQADIWLGPDADGGGGERASKLVAGYGEAWVRLLAAVVGSGDGITVSGTRDGGAVSITLLHPGGPTKRYFAHAEELAQALDALYSRICDLEVQRST